MELSWQEKNGLLLVIPATEQLRRGQFYYGKWYTVLSKQLLYFVDPAKWTAQHMVLVDSKEKCWELLSALLDLRCFGDVMDKVGTPDKTTLFDNLRTTYRDLGQRLGWMINMDENLGELGHRWSLPGCAGRAHHEDHLQDLAIVCDVGPRARRLRPGSVHCEAQLQC